MRTLRAGLFLNPGLSVTPCPSIHQLPPSRGNTCWCYNALGPTLGLAYRRVAGTLSQPSPQSGGAAHRGGGSERLSRHRVIDATGSFISQPTCILIPVRGHCSSPWGTVMNVTNKSLPPGAHCLLGRQTIDKQVSLSLSDRSWYVLWRKRK